MGPKMVKNGDENYIMLLVPIWLPDDIILLCTVPIKS